MGRERWRRTWYDWCILIFSMPKQHLTFMEISATEFQQSDKQTRVFSQTYKGLQLPDR